MAYMLKSCTQLTSFYKIKAHTNIEGKKQADKLAKMEIMESYFFATKSHDFAHTTPYYFQKDTWPRPRKRPNKRYVRCFKIFLTIYDHK